MWPPTSNPALAWLEANALALWVFSVLWAVAWFGLMAWLRRRHGLHMFRPKSPMPLFEETWCSGGRGILRGNNCVWVTLLPDRLLTGMHFPFNLAIPRSLLTWAGLDNEIALPDIVSVEDERSFFRRRLRITYRTPGSLERFTLDLRRGTALREALAAATGGLAHQRPVLFT